MLISILQNTPHWVWWLLATVISLGVSQTQPRHRTLRAAMAIPIVIAALSFYDVVSLFVAQSIALVAWAAVLVAFRISHAPGGSKVRWLAAEQRLLVPESWVSLMLILGLSIIEFGANVVLAMHPDLSGDRLFAVSVSLAYGAFSGIFLARGFAMWRTPGRPSRPAWLIERLKRAVCSHAGSSHNTRTDNRDIAGSADELPCRHGLAHPITR